MIWSKIPLNVTPISSLSTLLTNPYSHPYDYAIELIEKKLPPHLHLPTVLAEVLNLRINSAYRRIRAEHILSERELTLLSAHFGIDSDEI